jgi:tetratricopeptide (TPR) repeat protein
MTEKTQLIGGLRREVLQGLLMVIAVFWIYLPAFHGAWLWDDNVLITQNPLMADPAGLWKIWFQPGGSPDYYPLTFTVQRLEWNLWGNDTFGYHLVNVALHLGSAFLVWRLFARLGLRFAWFGGLIFAIHPVQVESVAWVAELKNALSLPPFLLAMCFWIDYDRLGRRQDYFLALGLFFLALLAKITVVMFPAVILLYAWWRRGRIGWLDLKTSAPFFAFSLAIGLVPIVTGVWGRVFTHLPPEFVPAGGALGRFILAGQEIAFYFSKSVGPMGLMPVYPKWTVDPSSFLPYLPWIILAGLASWFWAKRRSWGKHALLGLGFFLLNLLPCPGFISAPNMGYAWTMDHFLYLPIIGLLGLAVAAAETLPGRESNVARAGRILAAVTIAALFAFGSHAYAKLYASPMRLWTYNVRHNPSSWMVRLNLGEALLQAKQFPEAIHEMETALAFFPSYLGIRYDLGNALSQGGRLSEAIAQYEKVAEVDPSYHDVSYVLAIALINAQRIPEATEQLENLLQQNPRHAAAHVALGNLFLQAGRTSDATDQFAQASAIDASNEDLHYVLGNALMKANRLPEALEQYQQAAQIAPRNLDVLGNLGVVLARMGRIPEAAQQFELMLQIDPDSPAAHTNMGSLFLVAGKIPEAIAQYQEALRLKPDFVEARQDLARAQAMQKAAPSATTTH